VLGAGLFARQPPAAAAAPLKTASAPAAGRIPKPHKRLAALRELFAERKELTRAEVATLLGCAPNSATSYLRRLEGEGLIERIHTSAALRTSYFALRQPQ